MSQVFRFHSKGNEVDALMFEPCYTFLKKSSDNNKRIWIDFNMENVEDIYLIFHRNLGLASTLFNIDGNDRPFFQASYSSDFQQQISRSLEIELQYEIQIIGLFFSD